MPFDLKTIELDEALTGDEIIFGADSQAAASPKPYSLAAVVAHLETIFADVAQGALADTAVQPADIGTAAAEDVGYFATAAQGALADSALQDADIGVSVQGYTSVLAATTEVFSTDRKNKLEGIEAAADVTDAANVAAAGALMSSGLGSVTQAYSAILAATTASFLTADRTKLDGIEALADVTDAANVGAAGAFMKSVDDSDDITQGATKLLMTVGERDKLSRIVMVTDPAFGALGDGVTDDSAAIQAADTYAASVGATLNFQDGVYPAAELDQTAPWVMSAGAKILYNGATMGECIRCSATGLRESRITIDGDGLEPRTVYYVDGDENQAVVHVENVVSTDQAWIVRSVYVTGDKNKITATFKDLVNDGNDNDSSPQGLITDETATLNDFPLVHGDNVRSVVVNAGEGKNLYGIVRGIDCKDNAFYSVAGEASVGTVIYDGDDNACGFRSDANVTIGDIHILRSGSTSVFFGDCGDITIGNIHVHRNSNAVLHLNAADTGHIKIGSIKGRLYNTSLFAMPSSSGDVDMLTIDEVDVVVEVDDVGTFSPASFMNLTACKGVNLGRIKVDVLLDGISSSTFFYCDFNATFTYRSFIDSIRVGLYEADGVTVHTTCAFFARNMTQSLAYIAEGAFDTSANLRAYNYTLWQPGRIVASAIPVAGTWRRGTILWREDPSLSSRNGWVCTTAGTPGTWVELAEGVTGSKTHDFADLADAASETTTVTVTGAALGDIAVCSLNVDLQGIILHAWVSSSNTVSVRAYNTTGGNINLGSGTLRARVLRT